MMDKTIAERYPLAWPEGWKRTKSPERSRFERRSVADASKEVLEEVRRLGGSHPVISSNMPLRRDGLPRTDRREPVDCGVAVYFMLAKTQRVIACDSWWSVDENLHAIAMSLSAMRGLQRWGAGAILERALHAFDALPSPPQWWDILGIDADASVEVIRARRVALAKLYHPDSGKQPDHARMAEINAAADRGIEQRKGGAV